MLFGKTLKPSDISDLKAQLSRVEQSAATKQDMENLSEDFRHLKIANQHRHADELLSRHGLLIERVNTTYEVTDYEGTTRVTRNCDGLRAIGDCTAACIPHYISTSVHDARILEGPTLVGHDCTLRILKDRAERKNSCRFEVEFRSPLQPSSKPISYSLTTVLEKVFTMTRERLQATEAQEREYSYRGKPSGENISFDVSYPVATLDFLLSFPNGYEPTRVWAASYFIRETWQTQETETARIRDLVVRKGAQIRLTIPRPVLGFRYAIHWEPLGEKDVQKLRDIG